MIICIYIYNKIVLNNLKIWGRGMDKMRDENIAGMEMDEKALEKWKTAYKNCKKQRSIIKKDAYDAFIFDIKKRYNDIVKKELKINRNNINIRTFISFFDYVCNKSNECLKLIESKKISFYRDKRKKAVQDLLLQSEYILNNLNKMLSTKVDSNNVSEMLKQYNLSVKKNVSINSKFKNCLFSMVSDLVGIRCYLVVTIKTNNRLVNNFLPKEEFNFKKYDFGNADGSKVANYEDKKIQSRSIYLVYEKDIDVDISILGRATAKVSIYVSPNNSVEDFLAGVAVDRDWITIDEASLTKVMLSD
mgnify:FL=1